MRINKKEAKLLEDAIEQWQKDELLDTQKADELKKTISTYRNEFDSIVFYATIAAISCALLAFGTLVLDEKWIEKIRNFFALSELVIGFIFSALSLFLIWIAKKRKQKFGYAILANESFTVLIALTAGVAITYFTKSSNTTYHYYGAGIFLTAGIYGITAIYLQSKLLWICMLIALIGSWATQTYAWSADAAQTYFLGMNYPLRMSVFGIILIIVTYVLLRQPFFKNYYLITWYSSWIFFLLSGLFLSVSGNWGYDVWLAIKQGKLFVWAIAYTIVLITVLVYAFRQKDETLRDITIVFFLLNIYTRYFEYFWDRTNKGLFFALLALSFWLIGKKAEQLRKRFMT